MSKDKLNRYTGFAILLALLLGTAITIVIVEGPANAEPGKQIIYPQEHTK